jgi:hypothetical protein
MHINTHLLELEFSIMTMLNLSKRKFPYNKFKTLEIQYKHPWVDPLEESLQRMVKLIKLSK